MRVRVYVDGFNVYYGAKRTMGSQTVGWKWLDLDALATRMVGHHWPNALVVGVDYFTARIKVRPGGDPQAPQRQQIYLRALEHRGVAIHHGAFQLKQPSRPLVRDPSVFERFHDTEEKGSDVNLASRLLVDGFQSAYDGALIVSNDGDLKMPGELVRRLFRCPLGVLNPQLDKGRSMALSPPSIGPPDFYAKIQAGDFAACQLPASMVDSNGRTIRKPTGW